MSSGWDEYFLDIAKLVATRSKDPSTKVGAVIVMDKQIISTGYNGFPRKFNDSPERYLDREYKYPRIVHAELNSILNLLRAGGPSPIGASVFIDGQDPCSSCSLVLGQAGIKRIVSRGRKMPQKWAEDFSISERLIDEFNIEFVKFNKVDVD